MRNWFSEFGRSFKSGTEKAFGVPEIQRDLKALADRVEDTSITDTVMTDEIVTFLRKHPEQTKDPNFQAYLSRWIDKRPEMLKILTDKLDLK